MFDLPSSAPEVTGSRSGGPWIGKRRPGRTGGGREALGILSGSGLSTGEIVAVHSSLPLRSLSPEDLKSFLDGIPRRSLRAGEVISREGEAAGSSIWVIAAGAVRVDVRNAGGDDVPVRTLKPGDHFGEISFLNRQPHSATVVAVAASKLLELDRRSVEALFAADPRVAKALRRSYQARALSPEEVAARGGIDALL